MHRTQIFEALNGRRLLRFRYKDHVTATIVEPYTYGVNKSGNRLLSAWLISGETHDTRPSLWRLYYDDEMKQVEVLHEGFSTNRQDYAPNDSRFLTIMCRVAPPAR